MSLPRFIVSLALPNPKDVQRVANAAALRAKAIEIATVAAQRREACETVAEADTLRRELGALISVLKAKRAHVPELEAEERRVELQIGVLLGPRQPGRRTDLEEGTSLPDNEVIDLNESHIHAFRLMADHPAIVHEELDAGHVTRKAIIRRLRDVAEAKARERAEHALPEHTFYVTSCANLVDYVEPESVDVIITDPPYPRDLLPAYSELSHFAAHALRPGGLCVALAGQSYLPEVLRRLGEHLTYHWLGCYLMPGGQSSGNRQRDVNAFWKPICLFSHGSYDRGTFGDVVKSEVNDNDAGLTHPWGQSESGMRDLVRRFSRPGDLIADPFLGSGTIAALALYEGRRVVGGDADAQWVTATTKRIGAA